MGWQFFLLQFDLQLLSTTVRNQWSTLDHCWDNADSGGGNTERGDKHVDDGNEEDAQYCHVVDLVCLANFLVYIHIVAAVHDQTDSNNNLLIAN